MIIPCLRRKWLWVVGELLLTGCADRKGSVDVATTPAEAAYPGQLELFDTHMRFSVSKIFLFPAEPRNGVLH